MLALAPHVPARTAVVTGSERQGISASVQPDTEESTVCKVRIMQHVQTINLIS